MKLLIKYPTRSRPDTFRQTLQRYYDLLSGSENYRFIISIDADDETMNTPSMREWLRQFPNLVTMIGNSKTKVQAVNADVPEVGWDVLLIASDDMVPVAERYDQIIREEMIAYYPDLDGALWFDDGFREEKGWKPLCTIPVMGKAAYDRWGYVYHPAYQSLYCDNEYQDVLTAEGRLKYLPQVIIRHEWKAAGTDELYDRNERPDVYEHDRRLYRARKAEGFPATIAE